MGSFLIHLASATPAPLKRWLYRHPRLLKPLARRLKNAMPADGFTVVTIPAGPNKGLKLAVDQTTPNYYWVNDAYEPHVLAAMQSALGPGGIALDIGAHIGFDTMILSRLVGPTGQVIAFEPDPVNFKSFLRNRDLNRLANVTPVNHAVSDHPGLPAFAATGLTTSHLLADASSDPTAVQVQAITLDQWHAQSDLRPDFIKIDVENHESALLRGATNLLRHARPILLIEIHSPQSLKECIQELKSLDYALRPLPENECYRAALNGRPFDGLPFTVAHLLARPQDRAVHSNSFHGD